MPNGHYIVQLRLDEGVDGEIDNKNTMPSQLGAFILSNSKRIMNNFVEVIDGFKSNIVFYQDTDSLYIEKKHWKILNSVGYVEVIYFKLRTIMAMVVYSLDCF